MVLVSQPGTFRFRHQKSRPITDPVLAISVRRIPHNHGYKKLSIPEHQIYVFGLKFVLMAMLSIFRRSMSMMFVENTFCGHAGGGCIRMCPCRHNHVRTCRSWSCDDKWYQIAEENADYLMFLVVIVVTIITTSCTWYMFRLSPQIFVFIFCLCEQILHVFVPWNILSADCLSITFVCLQWLFMYDIRMLAFVYM